VALYVVRELNTFDPLVMIGLQLNIMNQVYLSRKYTMDSVFVNHHIVIGLAYGAPSSNKRETNTWL
jgi:hypothetical protein